MKSKKLKGIISNLNKRNLKKIKEKKVKIKV